MATTFEELVEMHRAVSDAYANAAELRETYGPPIATSWTRQQTDTYQTAFRAWRDLDRDLQAEITEYAKAHDRVRSEVEAEVEAHAAEPTKDA